MIKVIHDLKPFKHKSTFRPYVKLDNKLNIIQLFTGYVRKRNSHVAMGERMFFNGSLDVSEEKWVQVNNFVFDATLIPKTSYRGRSAAGLLFEIQDMERPMEMTVSGISDMLAELVDKEADRYIEAGGITGLWTLKKGGSNVHLYPYISQE